ncbi:hypothetical protein L227DRAFT_568739, partial [Lentinus tigrinus ALCF2SS1-6]
MAQPRNGLVHRLMQRTGLSLRIPHFRHHRQNRHEGRGSTPVSTSTLGFPKESFPTPDVLRQPVSPYPLPLQWTRRLQGSNNPSEDSVTAYPTEDSTTEYSNELPTLDNASDEVAYLLWWIHNHIRHSLALVSDSTLSRVERLQIAQHLTDLYAATQVITSFIDYHQEGSKYRSQTGDIAKYQEFLGKTGAQSGDYRAYKDYCQQSEDPKPSIRQQGKQPEHLPEPEPEKQPHNEDEDEDEDEDEPEPPQNSSPAQMSATYTEPTPEWEECLQIMLNQSPKQIEQLLWALGGSVVYLHAFQWARVTQQLVAVFREPSSHLLLQVQQVAVEAFLRQTQIQTHLLPILLDELVNQAKEEGDSPEGQEEIRLVKACQEGLLTFNNQYQAWYLEDELRSRPPSPLRETKAKPEDSSTTCSSSSLLNQMHMQVISYE